MKAYQHERRENAIAYIAKRHKMATGTYPYQTHLYKYLGMFEYRCLRQLGYLPLGYRYRAMENGPVPMELYDGREARKTEHYEFRNEGESRYGIHPLIPANLDYFSEDEIRILDKLIRDLTRDRRRFGTRAFSNQSHEEIRAWREAWERSPNAVMNPDDEFDNLGYSSDRDLTPAEEHFLIERALESAGR